MLEKNMIAYKKSSRNFRISQRLEKERSSDRLKLQIFEDPAAG